VAPHHDPVAAAEEIRTYAGHPRVSAIYLPTCCVEPLYGHHRYDPVYAAAQEAGLPVMLHSVTAVYPTFPFNLEGYETLTRQIEAKPGMYLDFTDKLHKIAGAKHYGSYERPRQHGEVQRYFGRRRDGVEAILSDEVALDTIDPLKPATLRAAGGDDFLYLLMPVRTS